MTESLALHRVALLEAIEAEQRRLIRVYLANKPPTRHGFLPDTWYRDEPWMVTADDRRRWESRAA
jgi:hypothetical protein